MAITMCQLSGQLGGTKKYSIAFNFVVIGLFLGSWVGRVPEIKKYHDLSDLLYGVILLCAVFGSLLSLPVITPIINRFGSQNAALTGSLVSLISVPILGIEQGGLATLIVGIILLGFCLGMMDVSSNAQAVLYEKYYCIPTLGLFHAMYAFGNFGGALLAGTMAVRGVSPLVNFLIVSAILLPMIIVAYFGLFDISVEKDINRDAEEQQSQMLDIDDRDPASLSSKSRYSLHTIIGDKEGGSPYSSSKRDSMSMSFSETPSSDRRLEYSGVPADLKALINYDGSIDETNSDITSLSPYTSKGWQLFLLWAIVFTSAMGEGSVCDWITIFFKGTLSTSSLIASVGFAVFSLMMGFSRMSSDYLIQIVGGPVVLRIAGIIASGGLFLAVLSTYLHPDIGYAIIGMFLSGIGVGLSAPIVTSIGGRLPGRDPTQTITTLTSGSYLGFLVGPPLFGGLSQLFHNLQWALVVDAGILLLITAAALFLDDRLGDTFLNVRRNPVTLSESLSAEKYSAPTCRENYVSLNADEANDDVVLRNQLRSSLIRESHVRSQIM